MGTDSPPSVRAIYEALFGVVDGIVDPAKSVLIGAQPSRTLPIVRPDGTPVTPEADVAPEPTATLEAIP